MTKRRQFLRLGASSVGLALLGGCILAPSQRSTLRPVRVGFLSSSSGTSPSNVAQIEGFRDGMRDLGWIEGTNLNLDVRSAEGQLDRVADLATELARLAVDIIVTNATPPTLAAKQATTTIPIVFFNVGDPLGTGIVPSLAHPGANLTGVSRQGPAVYAKGLELLHELVPRMAHIAALWNSGNPASQVALTATSTAAESMGIELRPWEVRSQVEIDGAFMLIASSPTEGLMWFNDAGPLAASTQHIVDLAAQYRLPALHAVQEAVHGGGLLSYTPSDIAQGRLAAEYVDKILKGVKPADLPVQQATIFDLAINLSTTRSLGLTIPPDVAAQVTEWVP